MSRMRQGMYWAAVLCLVYHLLPLVSQGLCWNVRRLLQEPGIANEGDGASLLGLQVLPQFLQQNEHADKGSGQKSGQIDGQIRGKHSWTKESRRENRRSKESCREGGKEARRLRKEDRRKHGRGDEGKRSYKKKHNSAWNPRARQSDQDGQGKVRGGPSRMRPHLQGHRGTNWKEGYQILPPHRRTRTGETAAPCRNENRNHQNNCWTRQASCATPPTRP